MFVIYLVLGQMGTLYSMSLRTLMRDRLIYPVQCKSVVDVVSRDSLFQSAATISDGVPWLHVPHRMHAIAIGVDSGLETGGDRSALNIQRMSRLSPLYRSFAKLVHEFDAAKLPVVRLCAAEPVTRQLDVFASLEAAVSSGDRAALPG